MLKFHKTADKTDQNAKANHYETEPEYSSHSERRKSEMARELRMGRIPYNIKTNQPSYVPLQVDKYERKLIPGQITGLTIGETLVFSGSGFVQPVDPVKVFIATNDKQKTEEELETVSLTSENIEVRIGSQFEELAEDIIPVNIILRQAQTEQVLAENLTIVYPFDITLFVDQQVQYDESIISQADSYIDISVQNNFTLDTTDPQQGVFFSGPERLRATEIQSGQGDRITFRNPSFSLDGFYFLCVVGKIGNVLCAAQYYWELQYKKPPQPVLTEFENAKTGAVNQNISVGSVAVVQGSGIFLAYRPNDTKPIQPDDGVWIIDAATQAEKKANPDYYTVHDQDVAFTFRVPLMSFAQCYIEIRYHYQNHYFIARLEAVLTKV